MRLFAAAATAAALALSTPAAAQPDAGRIVQGAVEQLSRNVPGEVRDYTLTIRSGPLRQELYVYRSEDGWTTEIPYDGGLADLLQSMVLWPTLATTWRPDPADVRYVGLDSLDGRAAHVLAAPVPSLDVVGVELPDSANVHVDAGTRQVLRVAASADVEPSDGFFANGGHVELALTFGGYETADGVTLPRRMHMHVRIQGTPSDAEAAGMRQEMEALLAQIGSDTSDEAMEARMVAETMLRLMTGEPVDISAVVEDVRVNPGPPRWSDMSP